MTINADDDRSSCRARRALLLWPTLLYLALWALVVRALSWPGLALGALLGIALALTAQQPAPCDASDEH